MVDDSCIWTSPIASQEIEEGPQLIHAPGSLVLRFRKADGGTWYEIGFMDLLRITFTEFSACDADDLRAYDKLLDLGTETPFAKGILQKSRRDVAGMRHFRIFFDDVGVYDVVAKNVRLPSL